MNLPIIFKAAAIFMAIWIVQFWFAPSMVMETYGWNSSPGLLAMMKYMGMAMAALATLHWTLPLWAGNNLPKFGVVSGIFWGLFGILGLYDLYVGNSPSTAQNIFGVVANFVFAILFYLKSKK
ncbi:MAG: hypothetical protein CMG75_04940 [Candidatus Marinimicrobia bacterium]|nr:hypothetical protein [Candidatus Neomarinimicrobiota bacterium]|tara:strand:- start:2158 stop:2526 length:369 start_codon:yes stop_codon:yes gene_type:complete